ncbi:four helix bundle protein [Ulvibacter sp. MAR_2010_11]|uniref:four helix bundle protein n=1 Tax=Ulvibacter sp. MAR_2010_11 TaxID=1250229 RepID=UPI0018E290FF|nr:four helix bundle protein [Ulvibacter sp. MAR_2010_11]
MNDVKENIIAVKTYSFAIRIVKLNRELVAKKEYILSKQVLKSGTSIGANVEEAIGGISKKDFRAKMSISYKEARETHYWLKLLKDTSYITEEEFTELNKELTSILKILYKIIESSK